MRWACFALAGWLAACLAACESAPSTPAPSPTETPSESKAPGTECRELRLAIRETERAAREAAGTSGAALRRLAQALEETPARRLQPDDDNLAALRDRYLKLTTDVAEAARATAAAIDAKDVTKTKASAAALAGFDVAEGELMGALDNYCAAHLEPER